MWNRDRIAMIRKIVIVVLTLAAVGSWLGSYAGVRITWVTYSSTWPEPPSSGHVYGIAAVEGFYLFEWGAVTAKQLGVGLAHKIQNEAPAGLGWQSLGGLGDFSTGWSRWRPLWITRPRVGLTQVPVPLWYPLVLSGAYPTIAFIRGPLRRYRRRKRGLCVECGYDLRGSPGRCPECGAEIEKP